MNGMWSNSVIASYASLKTNNNYYRRNDDYTGINAIGFGFGNALVPIHSRASIMHRHGRARLRTRTRTHT